jgi:hypothetical protein
VATDSYGRRHSVRAHAVPLRLAERSEWNLYVVLPHDNHLGLNLESQQS